MEHLIDDAVFIIRRGEWDEWPSIFNIISFLWSPP